MTLSAIPESSPVYAALVAAGYPPNGPGRACRLPAPARPDDAAERWAERCYDQEFTTVTGLGVTQGVPIYYP
jgi:hypothetical protein